MQQIPRQAAPPGLADRYHVMLANPLFGMMLPGDLDELIALSSERQVAKGTLVFAKGAPGTYMATVLSGRVRVLNTSRDGREVTLNLIGPGEVVGLVAVLDGRPRSADALALEQTVLMVTDRRAFLPFLAAHGGLAERLLVMMAAQLRKAFNALEDLALFDLPARLARQLIHLADAQGQAVPTGVRIAGRLSQRELANAVFSSRESVNKQLRIWRVAGVLTMAAGHIVIHDAAALRRAFDG